MKIALGVMGILFLGGGILGGMLLWATICGLLNGVPMGVSSLIALLCLVVMGQSFVGGAKIYYDWRSL